MPSMRASEIKAMRLQLRETQATFAERFGVDQGTVSRWETEGPPFRGPGRKVIELVWPSLTTQQETSEVAS